MEFIQLVYVLIIIFAFYSVFAKNLKRAVIGSGVFGLWISIAYMLYHAPDVAIAEAVISSSLATILFVVSMKNYDDISTKLPKLNVKRSIMYVMILLSFGLVAYLTYTSIPFIDSDLGILVMNSFFEHGARVNPVTGVVLYYRGFDTMFEALLLLVSSVGVVHLVNASKAKKKSAIYEDDPWHEIPDFGTATKFYSYAEKLTKGLITGDKKERSVTLRHKKHPSAVMTITFILPILVLVSIYLMLSQPIAPGGGFQGGALLSATFVSHYLIMPDHPVSIRFLNSIEKFLFLILLAIMISFVLMGLIVIFPNLYVFYFILTDAVLGVKVFCGLSIMFLSFAREHNKV
ncbi:MAG: DUF4040 domain-containing protein [Defluviitaleaceae bacterium]|nr:DUF4040 domain-containing protein [Defluviitaleaceae bacterium]